VTWTYTNNPAGSQRDEVRLTVGDTDASDPLVSDEEIAYALTKTGSVLGASAQMARAIAAKFARLVTSAVGSVSESASDLWQHYKELADELELQAATLSMPSFGGLTVGEHLSDAQDTGLVQAANKRDQFDNPQAVQSQDSPEWKR